MPESDLQQPHTGLGTSIVEALAHQLNGMVHKSSGPQGTIVTITAPAGEREAAMISRAQLLNWKTIQRTIVAQPK